MVQVPWWLSRFFCRDVRRAAHAAPSMTTAFGQQTLVEQFDSLPLDDFQQELEATFVDESYSYYPYELILPCTSDDLVLHRDFASLPRPTGRLVAGFDVGRVRDHSELAVFEQQGDRYVCRLLRRYEQVPFADQEADLRQLLDRVPLARLSIDRSGIGMHLTENLTRDWSKPKSSPTTPRSAGPPTSRSSSNAATSPSPATATS